MKPKFATPQQRDLDAVLETLSGFGLVCLGVATPNINKDSSSESPDIYNGIEAPQSLLIGNHGPVLADQETSKFWTSFCSASEFQDGHPNPMDRWSERIVTQTLEAKDCTETFKAVFPFCGPPWAPFVSWALQPGTGFFRSPLGMAIHFQYGLWCGFRVALIVPSSALTESLHVQMQVQQSETSPCDTCPNKPCLTACPANAFWPEFSETPYKVDACRAHLQSPSQTCTNHGCHARLACPIGLPLPETQRRFHMAAFFSPSD